MVCGLVSTVLGAGRFVSIALLAALLGACGSDGSKPAQPASNDLGLEQCDLVDGTVLGTPAEPIMIDGVATQVCRITAGQVRGGAQIDLKISHRYQPLAWLLDGKLEIGDSRTYASLDEFVKGEFARLSVPTGALLRATAGSMIVVHRNGYFQADVVSQDQNLEGSGEWAGVVVNSIGSHPECPANTSPSSFCNIAGAHGYYGGLSSADARIHVIGQTILPSSDFTRQTRLGFEGSVSEAGGAVSGGAPLPAAVVLNAPLTYDRPQKISAFDTAGTAIEINGGYFGTIDGEANLHLAAQNAQGSAVYWHHDFGGGIKGVFYHGQADQPALRGVGGDVDLSGISLIDRNFTASLAIALQGGHVDLTNVLVQNFRSCLQLDATASATLTAVAFGCLQPTAVAQDGVDHAARVTAAALAQASSNYYEASPDLSPDLMVSNAELISAYANWGPTHELQGGRDIIDGPFDAYDLHNLRLIYPDCLGIGTLLPETQTVSVGRTIYRLCELSGTIDSNARLSGSFNDGAFAWVLSGAVSLGQDFVRLSETQQLAALAAPKFFGIPARTPVYARGGASLTVQPGVHWIVDGNVNAPVEIALLPGDDAGAWGGVRVNGIDRLTCQRGSSEGVCAFAGNRRLTIEYLRVMQAGAGQPALQLHEVGPGAAIDHLQIVDSTGIGLALHGGRVNIKHLLLTENRGEQLVWERGYRGTIQYGLLTGGASGAGNALLGRNDGANHDTTPRSRPTLANVTVVGAGQANAILLEQGSGLLLYNSIVSGFASCLDIDGAATAALQTSDPQQIAMSDVVLNCATTLTADAEDGGFDYGYAVAHSATVYEIDPQLDENYLPTNSSLPATATHIDLRLAGDAANHLNANAGYWGAVAHAEDGWYRIWSGLGMRLSPECDGKGFLDDDYEYTFSQVMAPLQSYGYFGDIYLNYKVCSLPTQVSEDLELTPYTGADAAAAAGGGSVLVTENGSRYGVEGSVTWEHLPVPTIWLLDGMVTVGDGARELIDPAEEAALKANPVELTMHPGTWVMAADANSGLHVTRGARLRILGESMLADEVCSYESQTFGDCAQLAGAGPVSMFGPRDPDAFDLTLPAVIDDGFGGYSGDYVPYAPLGNSNNTPYWADYAFSLTLPWRGIVVDGFARNNQCPDAATAQPGAQVCNIAGAYGRHGGYDDEYMSVEIRHLRMVGGALRFNSVAGSMEALRYAPIAAFPSDQTGEASIVTLEGGRLNVRELQARMVNPFHDDLYGSAKPGTLIRWNHGYRGSLQYIYGQLLQLSDGQERRISANGRDYFVPLLRGANGEPGHEDALPRSMPTIANLTLLSYERDASSGTMSGNIDSSLIEVVGGSGLFLSHAALGTDSGAVDRLSTDFCFKLDASVAARVAAGEFVVRQLAATCENLSDNAEVTLAGMAGVDNGYWSSTRSLFGQWYDFAASEQSFVDLFGPDPIAIEFESDRRYPIQQAIDDYGHVMLDMSSAPTADLQFLQVTDYLGAADYWIKPF